MSDSSPDAVLYDGYGNALAVQNATAIPIDTPAFIIAGSDGSNSRYISTDTSGNQVIVGSGIAGIPTSGVISVQGVSGGSPLSISLETDVSPAVQNITTEDSNSNFSTVANGQVFVTGIPTTGSTVSFTISTIEAITVQVTGSWTGDLFTEVSLDGGTTWTYSNINQNGTSYISNYAKSFTSNFIGGLNVSGMTNFRVRSAFTGSWSGTATVQIVETTNVNNIFSANGLAQDSSINGILVSQSSTSTFASGPLVQGAVYNLGTPPTYSAGNINPLTLTTTGSLRTDSSSVTQPVAGVVANGASVSGNPVLTAGYDGSDTRTILTDSAGRPQVAVSSGTITSNQGTANTLAHAWPVEVTDGTNILGVSAHPFRTDPTGTTTQPISGTVTANIGTTNGLALDTSINGLLIAQGSTTSGEKGTLIQGAVTTSAPTYTTAQTSPLSLTTAGALRTDASATIQPVSGTVTANAGTGTFTVGGSITANAGTGNFTVVQSTASNLNANVSGSVTANIGTSGSLALDTSVNGLLLGQATTTSGEHGPLIQGAVTTSSPSYVSGQTNPLSLTTTGALRTDASATTQPVSGTITANAGTGSFTVAQATAANLNATITGTVTSNQGTPNSTANSWPTTITDGTHGPVAVKAASTAAVAADSALVVAISPNNTVTVSGTVTASNPSVGTVGSTVPTSATLDGGQSFSQLLSRRVDRVGNTEIGFDTVLLIEQLDSNTLNTFTWTAFTSSMTQAYAVTGYSLNGTSALTASAFSVLRSNRFFQLMNGGGIRATFIASFTINSNVQYDMGIGNVNGSNTASGAWFSVDFSGNLTANIKSNATVTSATISGIISATDYIWVIETSEQGARFIIETQLGVRLYDSTLFFNSLVSPFPNANWGVTHAPIFMRVENRLSPAPATAGNIILYSVSVLGTDINSTKAWSIQMGGMGRSATLDPELGTQLPQLATGAAPTAGTPSNTVALYTTLGGEFICHATATSENLLSIFAYTVPTPYTFYLQGIIIPPLIVNGAAVATTATVVEFAVIANCASVDIATGGGQRFTIPGFFQVATSAAVGTVWTGQQCNWKPQTPIACLPGTILHIAYKVILGTATASNNNRGNAYVDGFFE